MRYLRVLLYALLIGILAACGGDENPTPEPIATAQPVPTFTATALPAPTNTAPSETEPTETSLSDNSTPANTTTVTVDAPAVNAAEALSSSTVAAASPLSATTTLNCTTLNIDLSGYPDIKNLPAILGCPQSEASLDPVAINEFGGGPNYDRFMLWFGGEKQIYVLFANQSWLAYSDTWDDNEPEITCNPLNGEKTSPPLPRRGFGKLWCTVGNLQQELGAIDREERLCQHSVTQRFENGRLLACFEDATIRYFRILNDGRWDMMMVQ